MTNYDKTLPSGSVSIRLGDNAIRDNFAAIEETLTVEHNFPDNAGGLRRGRHKFGVGTQATRTAAVGTPVSGEVWYDTTFHQWSVYDGTAWRGIGYFIGDIRMTCLTPLINIPGWLVCNGQLVSRTTYASLFSFAGLKFNDNGAGGPLVPPEDGTNFRLPNFGGRSPVGWISGGDGDGDYSTAGAKYGTKKHVLTVGEMPSHDHPGSLVGGVHDDGFSETLYDSGNTAHRIANGGNTVRQTIDVFDIPNHSHDFILAAQGGGASHENRPPLLTMGYVIYSGV